MATFDELGKKFSAIKQTTMQKTQNLADTIKLKNQLSAVRKTLNGYYVQVGEMYFLESRETHDSKYNNLYLAIENSLKEADELSQKIEAIEKMVLCPKCGSVVEDGNAFCVSCGALINKGGD